MPLRASDQARLHLIDVESMLESNVDLYETLYDRLETLISEKGYS